jgi:hypothetical protein
MKETAFSVPINARTETVAWSGIASGNTQIANSTHVIGHKL